MNANSTGGLTIGVVICAHNEQDWIGKTLASLTQQKRRADAIVIVDNASTDGTSEVVQRFIDSHPGVNISLVREPHKGLWRAREMGWRATQTDVIASSDADITFPENWLEKIEGYFADPNLQAVTGTWRYTDAPPFINWMSGGSRRTVSRRENGSYSVLIALSDGACWKKLAATLENRTMALKIST